MADEISLRVELRPAFAWDCPECGVETLIRAIVPEFSPEDLHELRDEHGVEPWNAGHFVEMPKHVVCPSCKRTFATQAFGDED